MADKKSDAKQRPRPGKSEDELAEFEIYFDARDCSYWYRFNGHYCALKKGDLKLHLQREGYSDFPSSKIPGLSIMDVPFYEAQTLRMVHFTGPLSGHRVGPFRDYSGKTCLITDEANPKLYEPTPKKSKDPERLLKFFQELLPGDQFYFFMWWLKVGRESQLKGDFRPGQCVVFAGDTGCGKSLAQNITTEFFGGRVADPFRYMTGVTVFNSELCAAEHWQMSDPPSTTDMRTRLKFGDYLKEATVNRDFSPHGKGKNALCLMPVFHRITMSVNLEPECLSVVPPIVEGSTADKIFLFKCERAEVGNDREKIWSWVKEEIPLLWAFIDKMKLELPPEQRDDRFTVKSWHHPELLEALSAMSAEIRLLQIVDQVLFDNEDKPHTTQRLKAIELEHRLRESKFGFASEKLLSHGSACGSHLGKLAKSMPARVSKTVRDGTTIWEIKPPSQSEKTV
jgi:hypothetical protein